MSTDPNVAYTGPLPERVRRVIAKADQWIAKGSRVHFKWSCAKCGARQTFPEPNSFFITGECEECKHVTDLLTPEANVNFVLFATGSDVVAQILAERAKQ
jgi:hypothetical protein